MSFILRHKRWPRLFFKSSGPTEEQRQQEQLRQQQVLKARLDAFVRLPSEAAPATAAAE